MRYRITMDEVGAFSGEAIQFSTLFEMVDHNRKWRDSDKSNSVWTLWFLDDSGNWHELP